MKLEYIAANNTQYIIAPDSFVFMGAAILCTTIGALIVKEPRCFGFYGEWVGIMRDKAILNAQKLKKRYFK